MRLIPPVAVPAGGALIAASILSGSDQAFREHMIRESGFARLSFFPSGRAALSRVLSRWKRDGRDEVVIPAYTCWSVAASIVRAGLRIRAVDVDPLTLDYQPGALESACGERTVAVVAAHLFARTAHTQRIADAARSCGASWIDDAAQAIPFEFTGADAAILSFGRGKPFALGGGGALLTGAGGEAQTGSDPRSGGLFAALQLILTSWAGRPTWYRLPRALPFLQIGNTIYNPEFDADAPFYRWQARLGARQQLDWATVAARRSEHARRLMPAVERCPGWAIPARQAVTAGPLRLPVLAPSRAVRDRTRALLLKMGVDASVMYPGSIVQIPGIEPHLAGGTDLPGAVELVDRLMTLPTYPTLAPRDLQRIGDAFVTAVGAEG